MIDLRRAGAWFRLVLSVLVLIGALATFEAAEARRFEPITQTSYGPDADR